MTEEQYGLTCQWIYITSKLSTTSDDGITLQQRIGHLEGSDLSIICHGPEVWALEVSGEDTGKAYTTDELARKLKEFIDEGDYD